MRRLKNGMTRSSSFAQGPKRRRRSVAAEIEERGAVEEEVALLGKEQRVAREVDLPLVDFRLREVGVDGEDGPQ